MLSFKTILLLGFLLLATQTGWCKNRYALLIGTQKLSPAFGNAFDPAAIRGVPGDLQMIRNRLVQRGHYEITVLPDEQATVGGIVGELKRIGKQVQPGDGFVLYFSGHGFQVDDLNRDETDDTLDEVLVAYDGYLIDDTINTLLSTYFRHTQNVMLVDACHSGSSYKSLLAQRPLRAMPGFRNGAAYRMRASRPGTDPCGNMPSLHSPTSYPLIYLGATADDRLAGSTGTGRGRFTQALNAALNDAEDEDRQPLTYRRLACRAARKLGSQPLEYRETGGSEVYSDKPVFSFF